MAKSEFGIGLEHNTYNKNHVQPDLICHQQQNWVGKSLKFARRS